ncbi:hypothetical protein ACHAWX_006323 [Stephanocyclus meneghinianus]
MELSLSNKSICLVNVLALLATTVLGFSFRPSAIQRQHLTITAKHPHSYLSLKHEENDIHPVVDTHDESTHSALFLAALMASTPITMQPTMCHAYPVQSTTQQSITRYAEPSNQHQEDIPTQTIVCSSIQLATIANPIGTVQDGIETGINPTFSSFGQWFFLTYIVVSILAGGKEVWRRIQNQLDEKRKEQ